MCSAFLYEKGQFGVQYLAQGHFSIRNGEDWDWTALVLLMNVSLMSTLLTLLLVLIYSFICINSLLNKVEYESDVTDPKSKYAMID